MYQAAYSDYTLKLYRRPKRNPEKGENVVVAILQGDGRVLMKSTKAGMGRPFPE